jgi:riboflavin synthase
VFTGIIRSIGQVTERIDSGSDRRLTIALGTANWPAPAIGASVAVNGVCLTAAACDARAFTADVSAETLAVTTLGELAVDSRVNLEPALRVGDALDGHFVSGHVDGVGRVRELAAAGRSMRLRIDIAAALLPYVARKGSITVDGVSLTVNAVDGTGFDVNIVPHTREMTIIFGYRAGTAVNIEVDLIARYLERLEIGADASAGVNLELLQKHGYTVER